MKINFKFFTAIVFSIISCCVNAQSFDWANKGERILGSPRISVDAIGNTYICGNFQDSCKFGTSTLINSGASDIFLCKYNSLGILQWAQKAGGAASDNLADMCSDPLGNVYMTGSFFGPADFGGLTLTGFGSFIAKYSSSGSIIWVEKIESLQGAYSNLISINDSGKFAVAGTIYGSANFSCTVLNNLTPNLNYIASFDTSGACVWVQTFQLNGYLVDMTLDKNNNVYITGAFLDTSTFGTINLISSGSQDVYLAKCNSNGSWEWAFSTGSMDFDHSYGVGVDIFGHVYLTGSFKFTVYFGSTPLLSTGASDIFIACFNTSGNLIWVQQAGGGFGNQYAFSLSCDNFGNFSITGSILDTTHFGSFTLIPAGEKMYIAKYDSTGICKWAVVSTGASGDRGTSIAADSLGNIYTAGRLDAGIYTYGSYSMLANSYSFVANDLFVTKIDSLSSGIFDLQSTKNNLQLFPNPANEYIQLTFNTKEKADLKCEIINIIGEKVYEQKLTAFPSLNFIKLYLTFLKSGIYFLELTNHDERIIRKFVKE